MLSHCPICKKTVEPTTRVALPALKEVVCCSVCGVVFYVLDIEGETLTVNEEDILAAKDLSVSREDGVALLREMASVVTYPVY